MPLVNAEAAFRFLSETLALPVAWPFAEYDTFASGGVTLGGANLELLRTSDALPYFTASRPARVQGIVFAPVPIDDAFIAELDRRGIRHSGVVPFRGTTDPLWRNVFFDGFIDPSSLVFVCEYHLPEVADVDLRRRRLAAAGGGRLGVEDVAEVIVGSPDLVAATGRWQRLLDPLRPVAPASWRIGSGPALRIAQADEETVLRLVLRVGSLARAEAALGADAIRSGDEILLRAPALAQLDLRLI